MQFLIIMALMLGVMYVLMIRPQRQRQAQQQSMISNAGVGDDVSAISCGCNGERVAVDEAAVRVLLGFPGGEETRLIVAR